MKSLLLACAAPALLLPKFEDGQRWKRTTALWVPNREWATCEYEIRYLVNPMMFDPNIFRLWNKPAEEKVVKFTIRARKFDGGFAMLNEAVA